MKRLLFSIVFLLNTAAVGSDEPAAPSSIRDWKDIDAEYKRLKEQYRGDPSGYLAAIKRLEARVVEVHATEPIKRYLKEKERLLLMYGAPDSLIEILPHDDEPGRLIDPEGWRIEKEFKQNGAVVVTAFLHQRYQAPPLNVEIVLVERTSDDSAQTRRLIERWSGDTARVPLAVREIKPGVFQTVYRLPGHLTAMFHLEVRCEIESIWHLISTSNAR